MLIFIYPHTDIDTYIYIHSILEEDEVVVAVEEMGVSDEKKNQGGNEK
jgi:hypothetical protein